MRILMMLLFTATLTLAACTAGDDTSAPTGPTPPAVAGEIDWTDPTETATLADGTVIAACEGDGPFLCVERDGATIGTLEMLRFPVASFDIVDPAADLETNIRAIADDFVAALGADRAIGCGSDYRLEPLDFESFSFDDQPAFRYGYRGTMADGTPSELNLQYATIVGDEIVLVTAVAYDAGGCPGRDDLPSFDSATLSDLSDELDAVLRQTPIPDA